MTCHSVAIAPIDCARCPDLVASRRRVVASYGERPAQVLFIGEAPGYWGADRTGIPFHGDKSGKRLQKLLRSAGLASGFDDVTGAPILHRCAITNVVRCFPAKSGFPMRGRAPSRQEREACDPFLDDELAYWQPRILVPIGAHALSALLRRFMPQEDRKMLALHGQLLRLPGRSRRTMLPMRHPSRGSDVEFEAWVILLRALLESSHYEH